MVDALGLEAGDKRGTGFVATGLLVDFFDEALGDGGLEGGGVEAPAHGVAGVEGLLDDLVEQGGGAAMG